MYDYQTLISTAEREASIGCGLSDVLYDSRAQAAYSSILAGAPAEDRIETEAALRSRGFDTEFVPYEPGEGCCSLTGIEFDHCPCGQHP
jgi:hypothetical protein